MDDNLQNASNISSLGMDKPEGIQQPRNENEHKVGPIIAVSTIVLVLIIAALYLFASRISQQQSAAQDAAMTDSQSTTTAVVVPVTNNSDDVQSIQSDLNTSTNGLDSQNF